MDGLVDLGRSVRAFRSRAESWFRQCQGFGERSPNLCFLSRQREMPAAGLVPSVARASQAAETLCPASDGGDAIGAFGI